MTDDKAEKTIRYEKNVEKERVQESIVVISDICKASGLSPSPGTPR